MGLFKKFNHTKMIVIAENKFKEFYNFGMTVEEKKTELVGVAASAIFFDEARNGRITKDEVYKIILGLKDDSPFLKFADNEMNRVAIAKTCEGLYDYFLSEMISESNPVTALYNGIDKYHCSRRNGVVVEGWHENGFESVVTTYEDGIKNGSQVEYYFSGAGRIESTYLNGILEGPESSWYENGNRKSLGNYSDGLKDGIWQEWESDALQCRDVVYLKGKVISDEKVVTFYSNGEKESETIYKNGERNGRRTVWGGYGGKLEEGEYLDGKRNGWHTVWDRYGSKEEEGEYLDDERNGVWSFFGKNGLEKKTFKNGEVVE